MVHDERIRYNCAPWGSSSAGRAARVRNAEVGERFDPSSSPQTLSMKMAGPVTPTPFPAPLFSFTEKIHSCRMRHRFGSGTGIHRFPCTRIGTPLASPPSPGGSAET